MFAVCQTSNRSLWIGGWRDGHDSTLPQMRRVSPAIGGRAGQRTEFGRAPEGNSCGALSKLVLVNTSGSDTLLLLAVVGQSSAITNGTLRQHCGCNNAKTRGKPYDANPGPPHKRESAMKLAMLMSALLSGCCAFVPCHPGLTASGRVVQAGTGSPVNGADISVFSTKLHSGPDGCFKFMVADALPFTFAVTSSGYKAVSSKPPRGYVRGKVMLALEGSNDTSTVLWEALSDQEFAALPSCG